VNDVKNKFLFVATSILLAIVFVSGSLTVQMGVKPHDKMYLRTYFLPENTHPWGITHDETSVWFTAHGEPQGETEDKICNVTPASSSYADYIEWRLPYDADPTYIVYYEGKLYFTEKLRVAIAVFDPASGLLTEYFVRPGTLRDLYVINKTYVAFLDEVPEFQTTILGVLNLDVGTVREVWLPPNSSCVQLDARKHETSPSVVNFTITEQKFDLVYEVTYSFAGYYHTVVSYQLPATRDHDPLGIEVDRLGNIWITEYVAECVTEITYDSRGKNPYQPEVTCMEVNMSEHSLKKYSYRIKVAETRPEIAVQELPNTTVPDPIYEWDMTAGTNPPIGPFCLTVEEDGTEEYVWITENKKDAVSCFSRSATTLWRYYIVTGDTPIGITLFVDYKEEEAVWFTEYSPAQARGYLGELSPTKLPTTTSPPPSPLLALTIAVAVAAVPVVAKFAKRK